VLAATAAARTGACVAATAIAASIEVAAFHESFGDMSALLSALQLPSLREGVLAETGGVLHRASRLSRLAEQLGWAIRQSVPSAVEPDCLRNAVNTFFYRDPDTLPTMAPMAPEYRGGRTRFGAALHSLEPRIGWRQHRAWSRQPG
jgi:hypothetical protein